MSSEANGCGRYELLNKLEDAGIEYQKGDVLEFNCQEAEFLAKQGVIFKVGDVTEKPVTRKRVVQNPCAGCGPEVVTDAAPAA